MVAALSKGYSLDKNIRFRNEVWRSGGDGVSELSSKERWRTSTLAFLVGRAGRHKWWQQRYRRRRMKPSRERED